MKLGSASYDHHILTRLTYVEEKLADIHRLLSDEEQGQVTTEPLARLVERIAQKESALDILEQLGEIEKRLIQRESVLLSLVRGIMERLENLPTERYTNGEDSCQEREWRERETHALIDRLVTIQSTLDLIRRGLGA
ncbi:hypothetical protein H8D30_05360 [bacterium]|nr:hypothetical protein [bacterium]